jgi:hypothetical protein
VIVTAVFVGAAALLSVLAFRERLRQYPAFNMLLLLFTFTVPQLSSLPFCFRRRWG